MHIASHALVWKASRHWAYTIPSCPYTTLAVHPARYIWVPTKAVPSHRRPLQWFLWIGPADKHSIHHHRCAHHSPLCWPRNPSMLYNRQCPERQRSLMTTNFTRRWANIVQPHKSTPYPQCLAYETFFFLFMFYLFIIEQWVTLILFWTLQTLFVCICIYNFFWQGGMSCHRCVTRAWLHHILKFRYQRALWGVINGCPCIYSSSI